MPAEERDSWALVSLQTVAGGGGYSERISFMTVFSLLQTGMALLFLLGCVFFPLCFAGLRWGLQNQTNLQMERQEAVLVASK